MVEEGILSYILECDCLCGRAESDRQFPNHENQRTSSGAK